MKIVSVLVLLVSLFSKSVFAAPVVSCEEVGNGDGPLRATAVVEELDVDHFLVKASAGYWNATLLCAFPIFNEDCMGFQYGVSKVEGTIQMSGSKIVGISIDGTKFLCK